MLLVRAWLKSGYTVTCHGYKVTYIEHLNIFHVDGDVVLDFTQCKIQL